MKSAGPLDESFFRRPADVVARDLLGRELVRDLPGGRVVARLIEVEAYLGAHDRASHAFGGRRTPRNESMYLAGGHAYVYRIYGIHFCLNVVTGAAEEGIAVLLRAAEIVEGEELVRRERGAAGEIAASRLLAGPGNLCRGLAIDRALDGHPLALRPLRLAPGVPVDAAAILHGPRIGCESAGEAAAWRERYAVAGSPSISATRASLSAFRASRGRPGGASRPRPGRRAAASSSSSRSTGDRKRR